MKVVSAIETRTGREAKPKQVAAEMGISLDEYFGLIHETIACRIINFVDLGTDDDSLHDNSNV